MLFRLVMLGAAVALGTGAWLWLLRRYDRIEPESVRHLVQVMLVGGGLSVAAAVLFNEAAASALGLSAAVVSDAGGVPALALLALSLAIGFGEEVSKAVAGTWATRRWGDFDEPIDAMIYAMTVGLGFAAAENVIYALRFGNEVLLIRFLWPVPAHMAYAAVWGYGLARARFVYPERSRWRVMAAPVVLAALAHAGVNFMLFLGGTAPAAAALAVLGGLALLAHRRLHRLVAESPFLKPGECSACRHVSDPRARRCARCEAPLQQEDEDMVAVCPCGEARVPVRGGTCPACGQRMQSAARSAL